MTSAVNIANLALSHIGADANLSSLTEQSAEAEHCNRYYPIARRETLERHTWSFATRRKNLALLAESPLSGWTFAYAWPAECLKPFAVLPPHAADDAESQPFATETMTDGSRVICTNVQNATLRYVVDAQDTTKYTPLFVSALSRLLASYLAGPIIKGRQGMQVSQGQLRWFEEQALPKAIASDSNMSESNLYDTFIPAGLAARR